MRRQGPAVGDEISLYAAALRDEFAFNLTANHESGTIEPPYMPIDRC